MSKKLISVLAAASVFASCTSPAPKESIRQDILLTDMDTTVRPNDDFFDYANGGWMKKNQIPADETSFGIGELVQRELYVKLQKINEDAMKRGDKSGNGQQIGDFWYSAMDTVGIEKNGLSPLKEEMSMIDAMKTKENVMTMAARMHTYGTNVFFDEGVSQDPKHSDVQVYFMMQGGLGMPNSFSVQIPQRTKIGVALHLPILLTLDYEIQNNPLPFQFKNAAGQMVDGQLTNIRVIRGGAELPFFFCWILNFHLWP